jgi:two-component system nitrogen regulation response regulator NtrX
MTVCAIAQPTTSKLGQVQPSVLCVDDSQEALEICQSILKASGYQVFTASCGAAALELLQLRPVDVAVVDNVMPGMNGIDLARQIKSSATGVLVVMYSGILRGNESFPFVDACLSKGKGPLALRDLLSFLLHK